MAVGVRGTAAAGEPSEASSVLVKPDDKVVVLISIRDPDAETGVGYAWAAREGAGGVLRSAEGRPKPSSSISIELEAVSCLTMSSEMDESVERRTRFALGGVSLSTTTSSPSTSLFKPWRALDASSSSEITIISSSGAEARLVRRGVLNSDDFASVLPVRGVVRGVLEKLAAGVVGKPGKKS
jgi:hypothetical protein